MNSNPLVKPLLAGAFAGASGVAALALILVLWLGIGLAWQYAFYSSIPVIRDMALPAVIQDVNRLPSFLWSWRWALFTLALVGAPLAYVDYLGERYPSPIRERLAGVVLLAIVSTAIIAGLLIQIDQSLYGNLALMRNESLPNARELQGAVANLVLIGLVVSLAVAGGIWLYWSWWYKHWRRWMRITAPPPAHTEAMVHPDVWFERRRQRERLRMVAGLTLAGLAALAVGAISGYAAVRTVILSGDIRLAANAPLAETRLSFTRPTRALVIENTFGGGSATVSLLAANDGALVAGPVDVTFAGGRLGFERAELPVSDLPPGDYILRAEGRDGAEGRVGFALLQSDGALVALTAILAGIGVGGALGVAVLLLATMAQRGSGEG